MNYRYFFIIPTFLLLLIGCATTDVNEKPFNLLGMIYDDFNKPVGGVQIIIDNDKTESSDTAGRFIVPDIKHGKHKITAICDNYETIEIEFDLYNPDQVLYLKINSLPGIKQKIETALSQKEYNEAIALINRAESITTNDPVIRFEKAIAFFSIGNNEIALESLYDLLKAGHKTNEIYQLIILVYDNNPEIEKKDWILNEYQELIN